MTVSSFYFLAKKHLGLDFKGRMYYISPVMYTKYPWRYVSKQDCV